MKHILPLILLLFLAPVQPPLEARWERPGVARITHGPGCLYRNTTLIRCYDRGGVAIIGGPQTDAAFRPLAGDVWSLVAPGGAVERTALRGVVLLPVWRR